MEMKSFFTALLVIAIALSAINLFREYSALKRRIAGLEKRIADIESASNKRMPYRAIEEILDARAALYKEKEEFKFFISLIENAEGHLDNAVRVGTKHEEKDVSDSAGL